MSRRTKIVCTLGPATATPERIRELIQAGIDVSRLNFNHGDRDDHKRVYDMLRHAADADGHAVGIADLQGPKIRLGRLAAGPTEWRTGEEMRTCSCASAVATNVHRVLARPDDASRRCRPREDARYELRAAPCETPSGHAITPATFVATALAQPTLRPHRARLSVAAAAGVVDHDPAWRPART